MFGASTEFLFEEILGIKQAENSVRYDKVVISPVFAECLSYAKGKITTPHGEIVVSWKKENGKIKVDLLNAGFVSSSISLQVSKLSEYGAPAVLRYAPDFTIDAPDRSCDLYGDADSDGELSIRDVSLIQQYCAKISDLSAKAFISADVNCDCFVDINDVSLTQQALADLVKLPVA